MFASGKIAQFILLVSTMLVSYIYLWRADKGIVPYIRKIAALESIPEIIGRCVEMDKPVFMTTGSYGGLIEKEAATNLAGLAVLGHVARLCAKFGCHLTFVCNKPEIFTVAQDVMTTSYLAEGQPDLEVDNRFLPTGGAFNTACMKVFYEDGAQGSIIIGLISSDAYFYTTAALDVGALQIGGTTSMSQTPLLVTQCNYVMLGDECIAAGAITSEDNAQISTLVGLDWLKIAMIVLVLLGSILATLNIDVLMNWVSM